MIKYASGKTKITGIRTFDVRFPTSLNNIGTDAVHTDCDYSSSYVEILTDDQNLKGIGLTFTIGKGNELCVQCIDYVKPLIINKTIEEIETDIGRLWRQCTNHSQLRWLGPEKGIVHLAVASLFNGLWDLISKYHKKPLWKYIYELETESLLYKISFSYIDDAISKSEALEIIKEKK